VCCHHMYLFVLARLHLRRWPRKAMAALAPAGTGSARRTRDPITNMQYGYTYLAALRMNSCLNSTADGRGIPPYDLGREPGDMAVVGGPGFPAHLGQSNFLMAVEKNGARPSTARKTLGGLGWVGLCAASHPTRSSDACPCLVQAIPAGH
jgi:hypothetical protein